MEIRWDRVRTAFVDAAVSAVNASLYKGLERAEKDVPVRRVFKGGRRPAVRFKTANEIERDRELRSRLGLAPEILATPARIAAVQASGRNPARGTRVGKDVYGFARVAVGRDRANSWKLTGPSLDRTITGEVRYNYGARALGKSERQLRDRENERFLSGAGRYELKTGRAVSVRKVVTEVEINARTGEVVRTAETKDTAPLLGGGLRRSLRVVPANASTYPVIEGTLVAGNKDVRYAKYQELGTRHNAAHPFLRPRLMEWKEELPAQLKTALGRLGR